MASSSADAPRAQLTYFAGRGLAERIRWCLVAAKIPYDMIVLTERAEMLKLIEDGELQFNQLPLLKLPGVNLKLVQSRSTCRFIARNYGLDGETPEEQFNCDMLSEFVIDLHLSGLIGYPFQPAEKAEEFRGVIKETFDKKLPILEKALVDGCSTFLLNKEEGCDRVRYSDLFVAELMTSYMEIFGNEILDSYPNIKALHAKVVALPDIKAYLESPRRYPAPLCGTEVAQQYVANVNTVLGR
jgi:glutathione S-transferase